MTSDSPGRTAANEAGDPPSLPITPETYDLRRSLGFMLKSNARLALSLAEDAFSDAGELGAMHFITLMLLREGVVRTPGELTSAIGFTSGAVTRLIDHLEAQGFVERLRSRTDRRSIELILTDSGRRAANALLPRLIDLWNDMLCDFTTGEYQTLVLLLEKLFRALQAAQRPGREIFPV